MNARLILGPLSGLALAAAGWSFWPATAAMRDETAHEAPAARRTRTAVPEDLETTVGGTLPPDRRDELQASRDAIMDALHDQLDALDAEVDLDDTQRDRLETVLTEERTRGFAALDAMRRGPRPGQPLPDGKAIAETMQASRTEANTEARAALDDTQYAAWLRLREPAPRP